MRAPALAAAALCALAACRSIPTSGPAPSGAAASAPTPAGRTSFASVNGLRMYYEERGSGPALVLLHGGGSTAQTSFGAVIPQLARTHRVIAPEQQAHGHSGDRAGPLSFEQMADDTAALLDRLGVRDADVLGFSTGGVVAMQLALRHPRLVRRLILCSTFFARSGMPPAFWEGFAHASMADMPPPLRGAFVAAAPDPARIPERFAKQVALMARFQDLSEGSLRTIRARALVMVGDADVMSVEHSARLARLLQGAALAVWPGSAHGTYLGAAEGAIPGSPLPELAVALVEAFLDGRVATPSAAGESSEIR